MSVPRISSRTPLHDSLPTFAPPATPSPSTTPLAIYIHNLLATLQPKKSRYKTLILAFAAILLFSTYLFIQQPLTSSHIAYDDVATSNHLAASLETLRDLGLAGATNMRKHKMLLSNGAQIRLNASEELAAISSFIASLPQNVIPLSVDPHKPIDPQLVLDFDTRSARAAEEVQVMVHDVWAQNPVLLYSKLYSPASREVKAMLTKLNLRPAPTIVDVDVREDAEVLRPILARLMSSQELPILLVAGKSVGSMDEIRALDKSGELRELIAASGAVIDGSKRRKHRK